MDLGNNELPWCLMPSESLRWETATEIGAIPAGNVQVWLAWVSHSLPLLTFFQGLLSGDERVRANRYRAEHARQEFITARGLTRWILGAHLNLEPKRVTFQYSAFGKPELAGSDDQQLQFNVSHSGGAILLAISGDGVVGVDLERVDRTIDWLPVASRFYSHNENRELRSLPADKQKRAFYAIWTRKEAFLKAKGSGLSERLAEFDVTVDNSRSSALLETRYDPADASNWSVVSLPAGDNYEAAVAIKRRHFELQLVQWENRLLGRPLECFQEQPAGADVAARGSALLS